MQHYQSISTPKDAHALSDVRSHHATLFVGTEIAAIPELSEYSTAGLDVHHIVLDTLSIDDVRAFIVRAELRPVVAEVVTFVIAVRSINHEAQHALLKVLEEPRSHVRIFIVLPKPDELLPTVRSRLSIVTPRPVAASEAADFTAFIALPFSERIALIAERVKDKDAVWIDVVIAGAERYAHEHREQVKLLSSAVLVAKWRGLRGASVKMLLEELALSLPSKNSV